MSKNKLSNDWPVQSVSDLFCIGSGEAAPYRSHDLSGPVLVYGANGSIGSYDRANYGPGYIIGRVGTTGEITKVSFRVWASDNTLTATPKVGVCDHDFGGYLLEFLNLPRLATKNAQPLLTQTNIASLCAIISENVEEQRRIAEILDTIDEAIQKTEALISKLKAMKRGLLHHLLTRGLDKNGKLRDPKAHPEQFKEFGLRKVARSWTVGELGTQLTFQRGFDITQPKQRPGNVPVVSSSGITGYHDRAMVNGPGVVTGRKGKLGQAYFIESSFWPHDTTLWVKNFHENIPRFAALFIEWLRLERFDAATSVPTLNRNFIHPMIVAMPPEYEQWQICAMAESFDNRIRTEEQYRDKLKLQKKGLMHDLLTSKVRVKV